MRTTTSSLEHRDLSNYNPAVCQDGYDSDEPLRHPIVWDSYMNGKLFAGTVLVWISQMFTHSLCGKEVL